jgi:hypothetical protein
MLPGSAYIPARCTLAPLHFTRVHIHVCFTCTAPPGCLAAPHMPAPAQETVPAGQMVPAARCAAALKRLVPRHRRAVSLLRAPLDARADAALLLCCLRLMHAPPGTAAVPQTRTDGAPRVATATRAACVAAARAQAPCASLPRPVRAVLQRRPRGRVSTSAARGRGRGAATL